MKASHHDMSTSLETYLGILKPNSQKDLKNCVETHGFKGKDFFNIMMMIYDAD